MTFKTNKGYKQSRHVEDQIIEQIRQNPKLKKCTIIMFHIVNENNPKKIIKIGDVWISYCFMCKTCVEYLNTHHSWAFNLKWKTFDDSGNLTSAIPINPVLSFGKIKEQQLKKLKNIKSV